MKNKKNILIVIFVILGMYLVLSFNDHNLKSLFTNFNCQI